MQNSWLAAKDTRVCGCAWQKQDTCTVGVIVAVKNGVVAYTGL